MNDQYIDGYDIIYMLHWRHRESNCDSSSKSPSSVGTIRTGRTCRYRNSICNPRPQSNMRKRWSTYLNEMLLKTDSQILEIESCGGTNCFVVVEKRLLKGNMKIIVKKPRQTRKQFLVSYRTTESGYFFKKYPLKFNGHLVRNQFLHGAFKLSGDILSSVRNKG